MRVSQVILLVALVVLVSSEAPTTIRRKTTNAPKPQSAYAYLRSVRGKNSCAGGTCPFWERHGRSFAALRCYSQEYKECVCLHRMCFSSCMFNRTVCNQEMVSCLKQICPRCLPVNSQSMCKVYDSMAQRVAEALSVFACYSCCRDTPNSSSNNTSSIGNSPVAPNSQSTNVVVSTTPVVGGAAVSGSTNALRPNLVNNGGNGGAGVSAVNGGNRNNTAANNPNFAPVLPGNGAANNGGNIRNNTNAVNRPNVSQQVRQVTRSPAQRSVTTRRITATTRASNVKNTARTPAQASKKP